jgi:hypothetical protein
LISASRRGPLGYGALSPSLSRHSGQGISPAKYGECSNVFVPGL